MITRLARWLFVLGVVGFLAGLGVVVAAGPPTSVRDQKLLLLLETPKPEIPAGTDPSSVPRLFRQAQEDQMRALIPVLLVERAAGRIADFSIDWEANAIAVSGASPKLKGLRGVARVASATEAETSAAREDLAAAVARAMLKAASAQKPKLKSGGTSSPFTLLFLTLENQYFFGLVPGATSQVRVSLRLMNPNGSLRATAQVYSDRSGLFSGYFYGQSEQNLVRAGDRVSVASPWGTVTYTVPRLTVGADRDTNMVSGIGPPNSSLALFLSHCQWNPNGRACSDYSRGVTTAGDGSYSYNFSSLADIIGSDGVGVFYLDFAQGLGVRAFARASYFQTYLGFNYLWGSTKPRAEFAVVLLDANVTEKARFYGLSDRQGYYAGFFYTPGGDAADVAINDIVYAVWDGFAPGTTRVPTLTADVRPPYELWGRAPPNAWLQLWRYGYFSRDIRADAGGWWYAYDYYLSPGAWGLVNYQAAAGDWLAAVWIVPY